MDRVALHVGAIADAVDLENTGESLRDPGHHVGDQLPGHAVKTPRATRIVFALDDEVAVFDRDLDVRVDAHLELPLGSFDRHATGRDVGLHALGEWYGQLTDSRHDALFPRPRRKILPNRTKNLAADV